MLALYLGLAVRFALPCVWILGCEPELDTGAVVSPQDVLPGTFLASDLHGNEWFVADGGGARLASYTLDASDPVCQGEEFQPYCLLFQAKQRVAADGAAEVAFTWSPLDTSDGDDNARTDLDGHYAAVDAENFAERWRIDYLNFSGYLGESGCPFDPLDPCHPAETLTDSGYQLCRLHMPHDLEFVSESDTQVRLWLADTGNNRMLDVSVTKGSDCAVVNEVIGEENPHWDIYTSNNSVVYRVEEDGIETLLMSAKGSRAGTEAGTAQFADSGKGKIVLWEKSDRGWGQRWEFPPQVEGSESFVSNPHGVQWATDASGRSLVVYAHSLGLHDDWTGNSGIGSVGVLVIGDDQQPGYVADLRVAGAAELHFPRDVTVLDQERWIVTDSGCVGGICENATRSLVIASVEGERSNLSGGFSPDHLNLNVVDATVLDGPYLGDSNQLYSVEWIGD